MAPPSIDRWRRRLPALLVGAVAVLPFLNSLHGDFVFDDISLIREHPMVNGSESPLHLLTWVNQPGAYRPLTMLTYAANARVSLAPFAFHVVNLGLHLLVTLSALALAKLLLRSTPGATVTALLFAVHPIHTEAVSNIVGRAELLAALFVLASLLTFARVHQTTGRRRAVWLGLAAMAFAAALLSKESAMATIPLLAVLHLRIAPQRRGGQLVALMLPFVVVAAGYLALRVLVVGSLTMADPPSFLDNPLAHVSTASRLETATVILWDYLALLAVPAQLSADYSFNQIPVVTSALDPSFVAAAAIFSLLGLGLLLTARRAPMLSVAVVFFAAPLLLTANLLFPIGTIKAERLLYLPSFGWCLAFGWLALQAPRSAQPRWLGLAAIVVIACAGRTWIRNNDWKDSLSLFTATVATAPGSAKAHHNLAIAYNLLERRDEAMLHFRSALAIDPTYAAAAFGIGHVYDRKGLDAGALHWYAKAVSMNWGFSKAHLNSGLIRFRYGEFVAAETAFRAGLESAPRDPLLLINLSAARLAQGDSWGARAILDQVAGLEPRDPEVVELLAMARHSVEEASHL